MDALCPPMPHASALVRAPTRPTTDAGVARARVPSPQTLRDLGRRSLSGTMGHLSLLAFMEVEVPTSHGFPGSVVVTVFALFFALRMWTGYAIDREIGSLRSRWVSLIIGSTGLTALWAVLISAVQIRTGSSEATIILAFTTCGIASGTITALAPNRRLQLLTLGVLVLPVVGMRLLGYGSSEFAMLHAMFFVFTFVLGRKAAHEYQEGWINNEKLRAAAVVAERAAVEATATSLQLRQEITHRLRIEVELRQAQKLEAIGRLAAGIAHEINTPVQFINDSCEFLRDGIGEMATGVTRYRALVADLVSAPFDRAAAAAAAAAIDDELDLDYLRDNLPDAASRALEGVERVGRIVRATKEFAYPHETAKMAADLNRAIESTLVMAHHETKRVAETRFTPGELPLVVCHCGELNQVVLNLLVNAAHAIDDKVGSSGQLGLIEVTTSLRDAHNVAIVVRDNGAGIPPSVMDKIFEPFFTTKAVGRGSGQGLAIARSVVVDKHGGTLTVDSEPGVGSTFTLTLPLS